MADTKVRRVKAQEAEVVKEPVKKTPKPKTPKNSKKKAQKEKKHMPKWLLVLTTPFRAFGRYVAGAYEELKQTRWPSRKATWGLTVAVLVFTGFFTALILLVDFGFETLLEMVLGL